MPASEREYEIVTKSIIGTCISLTPLHSCAHIDAVGSAVDAKRNKTKIIKVKQEQKNITQNPKDMRAPARTDREWVRKWVRESGWRVSFWSEREREGAVCASERAESKLESRRKIKAKSCSKKSRKKNRNIKKRHSMAFGASEIQRGNCCFSLSFYLRFSLIFTISINWTIYLWLLDMSYKNVEYFPWL